MEKTLEKINHFHAVGTPPPNPYKRRRYLKVQQLGRATPGVIAVTGLGGVNHANIFKKIGKGLKKVAAGIKKVTLKVTPKPLRKVVGKVIAVHEKIGKAVGKVVGKLVSYPLLVPFMPVMGAALKKKGVSASKDPGKRAEQFYKYVMKNEKPGTYENSDHVAPAILALIPMVIKFIKGIISKKKAKKAGASVALDPVEEIIAEGGEMVEQEISNVLVSAANTPIEPPPSRLPAKGGGPLYYGEGVGGDGASMGDMPTEITKDRKGGKEAGLKKLIMNPLVIGGVLLAIVVLFFALRRK